VLGDRKNYALYKRLEYTIGRLIQLIKEDCANHEDPFFSGIGNFPALLDHDGDIDMATHEDQPMASTTSARSSLSFGGPSVAQVKEQRRQQDVEMAAMVKPYTKYSSGRGDPKNAVTLGANNVLDYLIQRIRKEGRGGLSLIMLFKTGLKKGSKKITQQSLRVAISKAVKNGYLKERSGHLFINSTNPKARLWKNGDRMIVKK